ncbi:hypothetical protein DX130_08815 [Paenibacillus paeoniae]|uniref:Tc1-like transposase DDE domain-containing protein n=1 Tax=Paenibacillus paeoniae TaxID=2292705 RepID=A0A371PLK5_9BACL|nr:hypothetical protein DX130_08815 [Paenibacillus paeoniae]
MIRDYQTLQRTWFEKGGQRIIQTNGKHRSVKLLEPFLNENKRLTFVFLPPYSPQLKVDE